MRRLSHFLSFRKCAPNRQAELKAAQADARHVSYYAYL